MGFVALLKGSFHSAEAYRQMREKASFGMGYSLMLVLLTTLFVAIYFGVYFHREVFSVRNGKTPFFDDMVQQIAAQVPPMTLHDHQLQTAEAKATTIKISGTAFGESFTDVPFITIDTSGAADYNTTPAAIFVSNKDVYIKKSKEKTEVTPLAELTKDGPSTLVITRTTAKELASEFIGFIHTHLWSIYSVFGGILWLFATCIMYAMRTVMLFLLGLVGLAIGSVLKLKVNYAETVSLASLSYTPIALIDTLNFTMLQKPTSTLVLIGAGSFALFFAIKASGAPSAEVKVG